ncbi:MAG: hypothetical protein IJE43_02800 [Alphaproteobacteria bacterium]|nr:hypothetical protein [Alphaproteobacteria bacterium]MBQ6886306.1 hypothetical protein [Lachnospiraceae bacterium]
MREKYEKNLLEIDNCKKRKIPLGITAICKEKIDNCYLECIGNEKELELELYERKAVLINDKNCISGIYYDFLMSVAGGFIGAIVTHAIDRTALNILENKNLINTGKFFEQSPMKMLYGNVDYYWFAIIFNMILFFGVAKVFLLGYKKYTERRSIQNIFYIDMCEYELKKINERLDEL